MSGRSPRTGMSTTPMSSPWTRTATAARAYGRPSEAQAGASGSGAPRSRSMRRTGPAAAGRWRSGIVAEPQEPLGDGARAAVDRGERERLGDVLGVLVRARAERLLELRERARAAGLAHVVRPAAGLARVLDRDAVQQVVGARAAGELHVHGAARVVRVLVALQHDDRRGGALLDRRDVQTARAAEVAEQAAQLLQRVAPARAPQRQCARLVLACGPALDGAQEELVEDADEPAVGVELDAHAGALGAAHVVARPARESLLPDRLEAAGEIDRVRAAAHGEHAVGARRAPHLVLERVGPHAHARGAGRAQVGEHRLHVLDAGVRA